MRSKNILLSLALLLTFATVTHACPMCKDSLSQGDSQGFGALPNGFNTSIEIMLGGFFATVTLVAGIIWKGIKG